MNVKVWQKRGKIQKIRTVGATSIHDLICLVDLAGAFAGSFGCLVCLGCLVAAKGIRAQGDAAMKAMLRRIVAMLTRMAMKFDGVAESSAEYCVENAEIDYDYEHRVAEHEHLKPKKRQSKAVHLSGRTGAYLNPAKTLDGR